MSDITQYRERVFENLKMINEYGMEYWSARDLAKALEYSQWRNFMNVVEKARTSCRNSGISVSDHFADISIMIDLGKGAQREISDMNLSRYACYLIVQNADSSKEIIALGQTYFAMKTRERELEEEFQQLDENKKRLAIRRELKDHNVRLAQAAKQSGVQEGLDFAIFQNHGYMGLYGGLKAKDIHDRKGLKRNQKILDHREALNWRRICFGQHKLKIS